MQFTTEKNLSQENQKKRVGCKGVTGNVSCGNKVGVRHAV